MTQEDKDLLLKDLCARLPYGVVVRLVYDSKTTITQALGINSIHDFFVDNVEDCKPYLRPMSSMTEEEKEERKEYTIFGGGWTNDGFDWLNAHHFDYHGLIPMGLALEAPKGMYKDRI